MNKKTLILFDLDGTLLDTSKGIYSCLKKACKELNISPLKDEHLHKVIGPPIKHSFLNLLNLENEKADQAVAIFREEYKDSGIKLSTAYGGITKLLSSLKEENYKLAVATLKPQKLSEEILEYHNISKYFDIIVGADLEAKYKKAYIMTKAMESLNIPPEKTLMIGDTESDAIGAQNTKVDFIPVSYGFGLKSDEIKNYPHLPTAANPLEIKKIIDQETKP